MVMVTVSHWINLTREKLIETLKILEPYFYYSLNDEVVFLAGMNVTEVWKRWGKQTQYLMQQKQQQTIW